jgi:hypothetical protein
VLRCEAEAALLVEQKIRTDEGKNANDFKKVALLLGYSRHLFLAVPGGVFRPGPGDRSAYRLMRFSVLNCQPSTIN